MRYRLIALIMLAFYALTGGGPALSQDTAKPDVKGLFLLTDYPAISVRPGTTATISLRLQNYAMPPERLQISVAGVPQGWTSTVVGGGQPIEAVCRRPTPACRSTFVSTSRRMPRWARPISP
jgi:hypothetical protein